MNVLHVNNVDILGSRFNGHDMQIALNKRGINANQAVMEKLGDNPHTVSISSGFDEPYLRHRITETEKELSVHALFYPHLFKLMDLPEFKDADLVHYHLLHNYFGALPIFPYITEKKPSVLTIHDPWVFTGHCIHPLSCEMWKHGCGDCQQLGFNFSMKSDNTSLMWKIKKNVFSKAKLDIIVASSFMMKLVETSPITSHIKNVHLIPFGIDTELFSPPKNKEELRRKHKIPENNFVICFRADPSPYKGLPDIIQMLRELQTDRKVTLVAVGNKSLLSEFEGRYQILDYEWITDNGLMAELYGVSDLFLMPSTGEAFGLMAIEAMATGIPIIVCDGTSLPGVSFAPECGICIPPNDSKSMCREVKRLIDSPEECRVRGALGRELVEKHYRFEDYVDRHIRLYEEILRRK